MPTYADVAPEVMEAFGTWFRDLRRKKKFDRGHTNAVVVLKDADGSITEIIDPHSHVVRLEEMQREAITAAEQQWRLMYARHGSLPRGPAVIAARLFQQFTVRHEFIRKIEESESTQRDRVIAARDGWMRDVHQRAEYELECLQMYVIKQLTIRASVNVQSIEADEIASRRSIAQVADDLRQVILAQSEANFVRMCQLVFAASSTTLKVHELMPVLLEEESASRARLELAAEKHSQSVLVAQAQQFAQLSQFTYDRMHAHHEAFVSVFSTIHLSEERERQSVIDAELSHLREIVMRSRQGQERMQRELLRETALHQGRYERLQERVQRDLFLGEASLRTQIVEAYIRWVTQVSTQGLLGVLVQNQRIAQRIELQRAPAVQLKDTERMMNAEYLARVAIQRARSKWMEIHFLPKERLERVEISKTIAARALAEMNTNRNMAAGGKSALALLPPQLRARLEMEKSEWTTRSQILVSEKRWREEVSLRMMQMLGDDTSLVAQLQDVAQREVAQRDALSVSEVGWRAHLRQTMMVTIGRLDDERAKQKKMSQTMFSNSQPSKPTLKLAKK